MIRTKSNPNDDSYGIDDSNKNPVVQDIKPTCLAYYFANLTKKVKNTINDPKSTTKQLQIRV